MSRTLVPFRATIAQAGREADGGEVGEEVESQLTYPVDAGWGSH